MNGKIYVVGAFVASASWKIYHPSADRWSRGVAVLRALYQAGAVDLGGKLYIIRASSTAGRRRTICTNTTRATPGGGWPRLPTPRGALANDQFV